MTEVLIAVGGGALAIMGWILNIILAKIDRLHSNLDECEKAILVLQLQAGQDQTVFTPRKGKRK